MNEGTAALLGGVIGGAIGLIGAVIAAWSSARIHVEGEHRAAIRLVARDFMRNMTMIRAASVELQKGSDDVARLCLEMADAMANARFDFETLRLTVGAIETQMVARRVLRYGNGLVRRADGLPPRPDEVNSDPLALFEGAMHEFLVGVRRPLGTSNPTDEFSEPSI